MKIAMLGQKGVPAAFGGIERHVEELSIRLAAGGHEVFAYARPWYLKKMESAYTPVRGLNVISLPSIQTKHLDAISHTLLATLDAVRRNVDVYHYHGVGPALLAFIPRILRPHARVITTFHCIDRKHGKWGLFARISLRLGEWAACRFAHETITVSKTLTDYCKKSFGVHTTYIPNGISDRGPVRETHLAQFELEQNRYIAMVSRLVRHKGAHYLVAAWRELRAKEPVLTRGLKLAIVGDSAFTDDYVRELHLLAKDDPSIVFTGYRNGAALDELFGNALLIVHPSESEGLPIAVLEAMSYGKVVLASDIPENSEVVKDHGVLFTSGCVTDLKTKLGEILRTTETLPARGQAARTFVLTNYHWDDIAHQIAQVYERTMHQKHKLTPEPSR